jgi:uncharacterized protein (DUF2249 family)
MPSQELDVRPLRKPDEHPEIFRAFEALTVGESFVLVNNHDPRHLREEFEADYPVPLENRILALTWVFPILRRLARTRLSGRSGPVFGGSATSRSLLR